MTAATERRAGQLIAKIVDDPKIISGIGDEDIRLVAASVAEHMRVSGNLITCELIKDLVRRMCEAKTTTA